jgi:hypothetical protein
VVLKEWAQAWNLYEKGCGSPRLIKPLYAPRKMISYWYLWAATAFFVFSSVLFVYGKEALAPFGFSPVFTLFGFFLALLVSLRVFFIAIEKALAKEFVVEYEKHRIADYPSGTRRFYLRYTLFLRGLAEQECSSEDIGKLVSFAEITGRPDPVFKLFQQPVIIYALGVSTPLLIDLIKQSEIWKSGHGYWVVLGLVLVMYSLSIVLGVLSSSKQKHTEIKRFLEWAKLDVEEEKSNITLQPTPQRGAA